MKKIAILLLGLLLNLPVVQAQELVVLKRRNPSRNYVFKSSENLKLKVKGPGKALKGPWYPEGDNQLLIDGQIIKISDIDWISIAKKERGIWTLRKGQDMLILLGLGLFTIAQVNSQIEPDRLAMESKIYRNSARLVVGGLACRGLDRTFRPRKVPMGKRFRVYMRYK